MSTCPQPVSGSFHSPPGELFSFPSRYSFAIGLGTYLALGAGDPLLPERIPTPGTRGHGESPTQFTPTGLSPSTAPDFHRSSASPGREYPGPAHPTSLPGFPGRFGLGYTGFGRPYSRHRVLLSFPAGTKMFQFPAFPGVTPQFGDPRFYGCMRLAGAYRRLPRPSSAPEPSHPPAGLACVSGPSDLPCAASFDRPPFPRDNENHEVHVNYNKQQNIWGT